MINLPSLYRQRSFHERNENVGGFIFVDNVFHERSGQTRGFMVVDNTMFPVFYAATPLFTSKTSQVDNPINSKMTFFGASTISYGLHNLFSSRKTPWHRWF
jgi:hypothetical protein